jgi:hypothetical protein
VWSDKRGFETEVHFVLSKIENHWGYWEKSDKNQSSVLKETMCQIWVDGKAWYWGDQLGSCSSNPEKNKTKNWAKFWAAGIEKKTMNLVGPVGRLLDRKSTDLGFFSNNHFIFSDYPSSVNKNCLTFSNPYFSPLLFSRIHTIKA